MNNKIEFMNLSRQYTEYKNEFMEAIVRVCSETAFSAGKYAKKFEEDFASYVGASYCAGVDSGTGALFLAVKALGIGVGDEVLVPANTFIASAWGVVHNGATPVFVDCTSDTWEIDSEQIEKKITNKTKAIIGVHLYGQPFDFDKVNEIAKKYRLYVIEDCAQAHGALYKGRKVGSLGDIACFSFYPGKNLGAYGEAGAITTNSKKIYDHINMLKNHGAVEQYHHDVIGYNMRLDGIQGAILSCKLNYLDMWNETRRKIAYRYLKEIKNEKIKFQTVPDCVVPVYHLFEIQVDDSNKFMSFMNSNNISCGRHYPIPCHLQKVFDKLGYKKNDFPNSEQLAEHCISLPMFAELTNQEIDYIIDICNRY